MELKDSARHKGHFALYNCLVLGHSKYKGVQRIYCNPFPAKPFYGSHRLDLVMIRPPGIDNGAFVVSPDTVWYARVLLLFSASATTDTGSKPFDCTFVSTLETYDDPGNGYHMPICIMCIMSIIIIMIYCRMVTIDWISSSIRAGPQKACSLCHPHSEYPGKTPCCAGR